MMYLIGSSALLARAPNLIKRKPSDMDFMCTRDNAYEWIEANKHKLGAYNIEEVSNDKFIIRGDVNCEFELIEERESTRLITEYIKNDSATFRTMFGVVPSLDVLFMLKSSHRFTKNSPHFWKTVHDYHILKRAGCTMNDDLMFIHSIREKETYKFKHPSLMRKKDDFFKDDNVKYVYDHDSIHEVVALCGRPAYTYFLREGYEVAVDKAKFFKLPVEIQLASVIEEACVLAIERSLVPHPGVLTPMNAWRYALSKVCTSITSGWWREFAYQNILKVISTFKNDYYEKFQAGILDGRVKLICSS